MLGCRAGSSSERTQKGIAIPACPQSCDTLRAKASDIVNAQGCGAGSSSERTRTAITAALRKKLRDLMGKFQQLRQKLQDEYRCRTLPLL